ncbi:hypothetical protein NHQ30_000195 [Ciborinia camelliae]|nr:hypothetical protein NHQ30_000195 [Ciborinia camelliae]
MKSHNDFDERFGIKELYRPADKDPEVDIVAVHGLNGHATMTWTAKESKICWLSHPDFLPKYVKNARILVWGWNSSFSSITGTGPSKNRIHDHAHTLVAELYADREKLANLTMPRKLCQNESTLVSALREESETLQNITDHFVPMMKNFSICFFWEQQQTDLKYTKDYIVEETSAAPVFDDTERAGIASDHSGMVKFEKNTSPGFRLVASILCRYCRDAPPVVKRKWATTQKALSERRQAEALEALQYINLLPQTQASS